MSWRKWLVRGLVFSVLGGCALGVWLYQRWTNPAAIRIQVVEKLRSHFIGANISVDSARLRLLGGISVTDLRMTRLDDPDKVDLVYIPSGIIYHDKEQLLHGKLAIRKLEIFRPRLRIIRERDGRWNLAGVLGPMHPDEPIPTIIIHHATILLEDRNTGCNCRPGPPAEPDPSARLEIKDVNLTMLNDPVPTLIFRARGQAEMIGTVQLSGTWQRTTSALALAVEAPAVPVQLPLVQFLGSYCPQVLEHAQRLEGQAQLHGEFTYQPGNPRPWSHDLRWQLAQGKLSHPLLPMTLDQLQLRGRCVDGELTLEECTARSGPAQVTLSGWGRLPAEGPAANLDFAASLDVKALQIDSSLLGRLPEKLRPLQNDYAPAGTADVSVEVGRQDGQWYRHLVFRPVDMTVCFHKFPYPLEHLQGTIENHSDPVRCLEYSRIDLKGYSGRQPIYIQGQIQGELARGAIELDIQGKDLPLDAKLNKALPEHYKPLAQSFHPTGLGNFIAHIRRAAGAAQFTNQYLITFHDATIRFEVFPYPLENVSGVLEIRPGQWEFRDFYGSHKGGEVHSRGQSTPSVGGDRMFVEVSGTNLLLDEELEAALLPKMRVAWKAFGPAGRMSFSAKVDKLPGEQQDLDVSVDIGGCTLRPSFFPCLLDRVSGTIRYTQDFVEVRGPFRACHNGTVISLDHGTVYLNPAGGFYAQLDGLKGDPIVPDADLVQALPPVLQQACRALQLRDPITLGTQLIIALPSEPAKPPVIYWDGAVTMRDGRVVAGVPLEHLTGTIGCRGLHNGHQLEGVVGNAQVNQVTVLKQPLQNVLCHFNVPPNEPQVLRLPAVKAQFFGGDVGGAARLEFGPSLHYEVNLTALGVKLEEFGRHNLGEKSEINGPVMARLYLKGQGSDLNTLEGRGTVDVPSGQMYNLPLLLDLIKVLGLRAPDRTAFEEAHAAFDIRGPRASVKRLDLYGSAFSLSGQGEMNLDGSDLQLDFYAVWGRLVQWLPPIIKEIPPTVGQYLLKVKVRGKVGDVQFHKEPVPVLVDPVEKVVKWMKNRGKEPGGEAPSLPGDPIHPN